MLVVRPVLLITLVFVTVCLAKQSNGDSSEEVSENCDDGLAAIGLARPCSRSTATTTTNAPATTKPEPNWCRLSNGTTFALGYTFIYRNCSICECTKSKTVRCQALQCLPAYCVDDSMPSRRPGQCCAQCKTDVSSDSCLYNGIDYPHGTVMKSIDGKMQCWCQWGRIECRQYISGMFGGYDVFADSATLMLMGMILIIIIGFGLLVCCSGSLIFYFYIQRNREVFQQAYDQYVNSLGWQPMEEEGVEGSEEKQGEQYPAEVYDAEAEKQYEAEQSQYTGESIPPPYAIYDENFPKENEQNYQAEAQHQ